MTEADAAPQQEQLYEVDPDKLARLLETIRARQSLGAAVAAGLVAAVLGAVGWAGITVATERQIGFMAIGVGALVGFGVRVLGRGIDASFAAVAALFSLVGALLGNFLAACGFVTKIEGVPFFQVLTEVGFVRPAEIMKATFQPMDLLFYALAVYAGWRLGRRGLTPEEIQGALKPVAAEPAEADAPASAAE